MAGADIRAVAMRLLAIREHSQAELRRKLMQKGFAAELIDAVLHEFTVRKLQSDSRYVENFIHSRQRRGYGPVRIQAELRDNGVAAELIEQYLDFTAPVWLQLGQQVRQKKFGEEPPFDYAGKVRQMRFLEYRGFTREQLRRIIETADDIA